MTKPRPPISIDNALARIAGQLPNGWTEMAAITERSETLVRKWGDHDQREQIPLNAAIALDIAYQRAGGDGRPLFETYALQVDIAREAAFVDEIALMRRLCILLREGAQAHEALALASLPTANHVHRQTAIRELEDVIREATGTIASLKSALPDTS